MLLEPERVSERLKATGTQLTILNRELNMYYIRTYNTINQRFEVYGYGHKSWSSATKLVRKLEAAGIEATISFIKG